MYVIKKVFNQMHFRLVLMSIMIFFHLWMDLALHSALKISPKKLQFYEVTRIKGAFLSTKLATQLTETNL